jgi:hypothetical protein
MMFKSHIWPTIKVNNYNVTITTITEYVLLQNDSMV